MEEIYLVVGGQYSDWWIDSYFTDKEKAEKYCLVKNKGKDSDDSLYVDSVSFNESKIAYDKITMKLYWNTNFDLKNGKWIPRDSSSFDTYLGDRKETVSERYKHNRSIWSISCTAKTEEEARKIAFDLIIHVPKALS